jgi:transcriptional regulator with XRE-family HTH domain
MKRMRLRFCRLREFAGLTQHEVAKLSKLERSRLSLFENGRVSLTPQEEKALERTLMRAVAARIAKLQRVLSGRQHVDGETSDKVREAALQAKENATQAAMA